MKKYFCFGVALALNTIVLLAQQTTFSVKNKQNLPKAIVFNLSQDNQLHLSLVSSGKFKMGTPNGRLVKIYDEKEHKVTISENFYMGKYEVTQKQFKSVMGYNPSALKGDNHPVENLSWQESMNFCKELNKKFKKEIPAGYHFSLPTEAQWEYACKAGKNSDFNNGKNLSSKTKCKRSNSISWNSLNSKNTHHDVGQKQPNDWGLYDMHGNVWEMCLDWYGEYDKIEKDPTGPSKGTQKVVRGGSFENLPRYGRSSDRHLEYPNQKLKNKGFRIVLTKAPSNQQ